MTFQRIDTVILGAGIGGLTAGFELAKSGRRVLIAEPRDVTGGVISSIRRDGFLLETGPNSFSSAPALVMELIDEIGLGDLALTQPMRENDRFIWYGGKLRKAGPGMLLSPGFLSFGEKLRVLRGYFKSVPPPTGDIALGEYFRQRLGEGAVRKVLKPFLAGIFAADADRVSFEATFAKLYGPALETNSIRKMLKQVRANRDPGPPKCLVSFPDGVYQLPQRLTEKFSSAGGELLLGARGRLIQSSDGKWRYELGDDSWEAPDAIIATPAAAAADIIQETTPACGEELKQIEYAPMAIVHVGVKESQLRESRNGFGFLSVNGQGVRALGMIWSDRIFPGRAPDGYRLLTVFYGGEIDSEILTMSDNDLREQLKADLRKTMGFAGGNFALLEVTKWDRALPVFRVGHMRLIEKLDSMAPAGLHFLGNWRGGVSIPDRIVAAQRLAIKLQGPSQA